MTRLLRSALCVALPAVLTLAATGCDDVAAPGEPVPVSIAFASSTQPAALATAPARAATVEGSNGTLELSSVLLIVSEFELEGADDACPDPGDDDGDLEDCAEFESGPFLLDLPLDGAAVTVANEGVPAGFYEELEFEIEDVEIDEDDEDRAEDVLAVRQGALAAHPDWPDEASMVIEGTFTPVGGEARAFRVFAEAEIEIERDLTPHLEVVEGVPAEITVVLDPGAWFTRSDGTVLDLSAWDWTGDEDDLLELEAEFEDGVVEIEIDDD